MHALISYASHNQTCYFTQEMIVLFAVFYLLKREQKSTDELIDIVFFSIFPSVLPFFFSFRFFEFLLGWAV